jgi:hypothetical protein
MGVFDYLSSLFDTKETPSAAVDRPAPDPRPPAGEIVAPQRRATQARKGKKADADRRERALRSKDVFAAAPDTPSRPAPTPAETAVATIEPPTPTAPEVDAPLVTESEADRALEAAFGDGAADNVTHVSAIARELDQAAVRELFASIAANHARPVKNFIFELRRGAATKEWIEVCRPIMATLVQGAEAMGVDEAIAPMRDFDEALALAADGTTGSMDATTRGLLLAAWDDMAKVLPEAFEADAEERRRDGMIIHALLKQIPDVGAVTFERLYGAGLTTLEALLLASPNDLAATTGIPMWLCERICERVREHRRDIERLQKSQGMVERRARLRTLVEELRERHEGFERAARDDWSDAPKDEEKRVHRQARQLCALKIEVVLAEMGEMEMVEQIQKLPFGPRIEKLEQFIHSAAEGLDAQAGAPVER